MTIIWLLVIVGIFVLLVIPGNLHAGDIFTTMSVPVITSSGRWSFKTILLWFIDRITPRLYKECGLLVWVFTLLCGTAGIPFMYQLDETGYNEQKEAFDRLWSELKSAYRTKPEFQVFFLSVFLFYCFIFFALVLCRFGNYFIFPLIACWVGEIFFGSSYSYNFFLAFGITAMLLNMAGYILGTLRLLPKTADWIFTQLDKKTLYTIIGNPGGKVGRGVARMVWYSASIGIGTFAYDSAVAVRENHFMHQDMKEYTSTGAAITPTKLEEFQLKRDRRIDACRIAPKLQHLSSDINKTVTSLIGKDGPR